MFFVGTPDMTFRIGNEEISVDEMVQLAAISPQLFNSTFFPKTVRQLGAPFHDEMDDILDDPRHRLVHFRAFRGSSKTTRLRLFSARRVSYGFSRTVLYVGLSEAHATRSLNWLRGQVERNKLWTGTFGLRPGKKWQETEAEIINEKLGITSWFLGVGITGNIRGINFDDYRPDLIICDDILSDENTATREQREKIINLVEGALKESLAPRTEDPNAKLAFLQTPMHVEDASAEVEKDPQWTTRTYACWTPETLDAPLAEQESSWPARYPSEDLRRAKSAAAARHRLSIWVRENECRLTSPERVAFRPEWLNITDDIPDPSTTYNVLAIDPVPPPSPLQMAKGFAGKDYEAIEVWGRANGNYYRHYGVQNRGHDPSWTVNTALQLARQFKVVKIRVESIAYQRALAWIFRQEMLRRGTFYQIDDFSSNMKKYNRIVSTFNGDASHGRIYVHSSHTDFITQFMGYGTGDHDDILDAASMCLMDLINPVLELGGGMVLDLESDGASFGLGGCP